MSSKQKYLLKITEYFFDGHGCPRKGETKISITDKEIYSKLDNKLYYRDLEGIDLYYDSENNDYYLEDLIIESEYLHAQDGYNCVAEEFSIKAISDEKAEEIENILKLYKSI